MANPDYNIYCSYTASLLKRNEELGRERGQRGVTQEGMRILGSAITGLTADIASHNEYHHPPEAEITCPHPQIQTS
ncbi:MAG TPA: hypothetical protein VIM53_00720 [Candidatus Saccharimonadales bacterium]